MRQLKKALDKIPQLLVFTDFEVCSQKTGNTFSALTLSCSSHSSATNDAYSFFRKSTSVSLTRLSSKRMLRSLSNSLTEMLLGPTITWGSRDLKKQATGSLLMQMTRLLLCLISLLLRDYLLFLMPSRDVLGKK